MPLSDFNKRKLTRIRTPQSNAARPCRNGWFWAMTVGALALVAPAALAQQFTDVSVAAGLHREPTRSWGNPMWGDFNNDGQLDLFMPNHEAPSQTEGGVYPY